MSIRREPTYLSTEVWRALWLLSRSLSSEGHLMTVDEIADFTLRESIVRNYPQIFEHQKQLEKLDRKLIESLHK